MGCDENCAGMPDPKDGVEQIVYVPALPGEKIIGAMPGKGFAEVYAATDNESYTVEIVGPEGAVTFATGVLGTFPDFESAMPLNGHPLVSVDLPVRETLEAVKRLKPLVLANHRHQGMSLALTQGSSTVVLAAARGGSASTTIDAASSSRATVNVSVNCNYLLGLLETLAKHGSTRTVRLSLDPQIGTEECNYPALLFNTPGTEYLLMALRV